MKYVLFDGYALAYRALYGYPELTNDKGRDTRVTVGFFRIVNSLLTRHQLTDRRVVFVFDSKGGSFRNQLDSNYKANRKAKEQSFYTQVDEIVSLCSKLWTVYREAGYEADDLMGSFVCQKLQPEDDCVLVTVDKDWLQLLRPNVTAIMLSTNGKVETLTDQKFFADNGGIPPLGLIDLKALMGDSSDNIPGVKGIGWVTAQRLIKQYKTVENIYENILMIPNKGKVQSLLIENKERVFLNKTLATIKCDVPLTADLKTKTDPEAVCEVLDYLEDELNAYDLANQMGVLLQLLREHAE